jgi:peroxiredoxin
MWRRVLPPSLHVRSRHSAGWSQHTVGSDRVDLNELSDGQFAGEVVDKEILAASRRKGYTHKWILCDFLGFPALRRACHVVRADLPMEPRVPFARAAIALAAIALVCLLPGPASAISVGDRAPDFVLSDQNGASHSLSGDAGKVRLVNFFGYSAPVCAETSRQLESDFNSAYGAKGLVVLGLDCWDGTTQQLRDFASANGVSYTLLGGAGDTASLYGVSYNSFVVIDREGVVRLVLQGPDASAYDHDRIEKTVKSLLQDPAALEEQTWGAIKALFNH